MQNPFQRKVFISYRAADQMARMVIADLYLQLEALYGSGSVFWDRESLVGGRWDEQLEANIAASDAVIVLIGDSEDWKGCVNGRIRIKEDDDWVRREVALALQQATGVSGKLVIPLLITKDSGVPGVAELPSDLATLSKHQGQNLSALGGEGSPLVERVNLFCTWLAKTLPLPQDRRALIKRLMAPLRSPKAMSALSTDAPLKSWIPLFWVAAGILPSEERRTLFPLDREKMLTHLAGIRKNLPMLQFLVLALKRLKLPKEVEDVWWGIIGEACERPHENGWFLGEVDSEKLYEAAANVELAPRLQVHLEERRTDSGASFELAVSGSISLGWDQRPLALENSSVPWTDRLTNEEQQIQLAKILHRLHVHLIDLLGDIAQDVENLPRLELYLKQPQLGWDFDRLKLSDGRCVGQVFRITRRLYQRHYGDRDATFPAWERKSTRYLQCGKAPLQRRVVSLNDWPELSGADGEHLCFTIPRRWEPLAFTEVVRQGMIGGIWLQQADCSLTVAHLREALDEPRWVQDVVADKRLTGDAWHHAAVLVDPFESARPYNSRFTQEPDLDEIPV